MTLPTGTISMSQVDTELGSPSTTTISLNQSNVRALAGVPSGAISMSNLQGKSNTFSFSFAGGTNVNLATVATSNGWPGTAKLIATNTGTITSASTGSYALTLSGSFPGGVQFINNALIVGRGGDGGGGGGANGTSTPGSPGGAAGPALFVSTPVTITNNSTIAGGGGGGGGGGGAYHNGGSGGGGGGGGIGNSSGGGGGSSPLSNGNPGGGGTTTAVGGGGSGSGTGGYAGAGASGGSYGSTGGTGGQGNVLGSVVSSGGPGGTAGACTQGNSNITWAATGNRYGALN